MDKLERNLHRTLREVIFNGGQDAGSTALLGVDGKTLSYRGLRKQIGYVVGALESLGFRHGQRVALVMPNGPQMAVALLSVMAGFACAPLNPGYREAELEQLLTGMKASCILAQAGARTPAASVAAKTGIALVELEADAGDAGTFAIKGVERVPETDHVWTGGDDAVLLLHTSGTTAKPKLVGLTNGNVVHSVAVIRDWLGLTAGDRCLGMMPLFHVHGQITVFASLAAGGSVVCTPGFDPERFAGWLSEFRPTWYSAVPTIHRAILDTLQPDTLTTVKGRLRFIRSASSALPVKLIRELEDAFKVPVIEAYGMTEASHGITSNPLPPLVRKAGSVGLPFPGEEVAVIGEGGEALGDGEVGEIVIRGQNVIRGYLDDPEADARSFMGGWLRTGDLGYKDRDGYLFIEGRIKDLINRGGEKVSPREVEDALLANQAVSQAIVFPVPHPTLGEDVAAAVVLRKGSSVGEERLRSELLGVLAQHKVPYRIFFVDEIPKSPTGKPQRGGMMERLKISPAAGEEDRDVKGTDMEEMVLKIWKEVLRSDQIGKGERFLEAGGDSLRAAQVASRLMAEFGVELAVGALFEADTIAEQARLVESSLSKKGSIGKRDR